MIDTGGGLMIDTVSALMEPLTAAPKVDEFVAISAAVKIRLVSGDRRAVAMRWDTSKAAACPAAVVFVAATTTR
jgi:hypothetical protein